MNEGSERPQRWVGREASGCKNVQFGSDGRNLAKAETLGQRDGCGILNRITHFVSSMDTNSSARRAAENRSDLAIGRSAQISKLERLTRSGWFPSQTIRVCKSIETLYT
jgi:hypothetical protein